MGEYHTTSLKPLFEYTIVRNSAVLEWETVDYSFSASTCSESAGVRSCKAFTSSAAHTHTHTFTLR